MQNQYNLLRRHDERELMAMCGDMGVGLMPVLPERERPPRPPGRRAEPPFQHRQGRPSVRLALRRARHQRRAEARRGTRRQHGPDRARVGSPQPVGLGANRRSDQTEPPNRSSRCARPRTDKTKRCKNSKRPTSNTGHRGTRGADARLRDRPARVKDGTRIQFVAWASVPSLEPAGRTISPDPGASSDRPRRRAASARRSSAPRGCAARSRAPRRGSPPARREPTAARGPSATRRA